MLEQSILKAYPRNEIDEKDLPFFLLQMPSGKSPNKEVILSMMKDEERKTIRLALEKTNGNKRKAAMQLGISRAGLYQKLHRLGMM